MYRLIVFLLFLIFSVQCLSQENGFIENKGQITDQNYNPNPSVKYLLPGNGMNVQLRNNGFSYDLYSEKKINNENISDTNKKIIREYNRIDFNIIGCNSFQIKNENQIPGTINYYTTGTPADGVRGVKSFGKIIYKEIYPGIDVEFITEKQNSFKYNFIIRPGADINDLKIKTEGAPLTVSGKGSLIMETPSMGIIEETIPESYYETGGLRKKINSSFYKDEEGFIGINLNEKIPESALLVIDPFPTRLWGTYFGGSQTEVNTSGDSDGSGNFYVSGGTESSGNIATSGAFQTVLAGPMDGYIAKFSSAGNRIWSTYYGGSADEVFREIKCAGSGILYLTGSTDSPSGIATPGAHQTTCGSFLLNDAMIVKFDTSGTRIWATYYGGTETDYGFSCDADASGNVYVLGYTLSDNAISTPGAHQVNRGGMKDGFLVKFSPAGVRLWGTYYGGDCNENINFNNCKTDGSFIYIGGNTCSATNISGPGAYQPVISGTGTADAFLAKFTTLGTRVWGTYFGGTSDDDLWGMSLTANNIIFTGKTTSSNGIATPGAFKTTLSGPTDCYLAKFTKNGFPDWVTYYGGSSWDETNDVDCDENGNMYFVGHTGSTDNISTPGSFQETPGSITDGMIAGFDPAGNRLWGTYFGGDNNDYLLSCEYAGNLTLYAVGGGSSTNAIATPGAFDEIFDGGIYDAYIEKFNLCNPPEAAGQITGQSTVCVPATNITYTVPVIAQATGYQWQVPAGVTIVSGNNTNSITVGFSGAAVSGNITVQGTNSCGNGLASGFPVTVTAGVQAGVTISASSNNICAGTQVSFTANALNGGSTPVFEWKVNGVVQGTNNPVFTYVPVNNDAVKCKMTSSLTSCVSNNPSESAEIIMTVNPLLPVDITITPSPVSPCSGSPVSYTSAIQNGGQNPLYQWTVNGVNSGTGNSFSFIPTDGDIIKCILTSSDACAINNPDTSAADTVFVSLMQIVGLTVSASANPVCEGLPVTFTASATNQGPAPVYQWLKNGIAAGNGLTYTYTPANNDVVSCSVTSSLSCVSNNPASSNQIVMSLIPASQINFPSCFDTITLVNAKPVKLKGAVPYGGTYSGPGVNPATGIFTPALAGTGNKTITYTYINAGMCSSFRTKTITVLPAQVLTCGNQLSDIRDNRKYKTVQIGTQCWFAEDLSYGIPIPQNVHQTDNCVAEKYAVSVPPPFGGGQEGVYQWDELMQYDDTPGSKGICPPGWHVPTETEWQTLFSNWTNMAFAGAPLKYTGFSGFNAFPSGMNYHNAAYFSFSGFGAFFWTSTSHGSYKAWARGINEPDFSVSDYPSSRQNAFAVRCLKD